MKSIDLSFDTERLIIGLKRWVETESPTIDSVAVNKVIDQAEYELASIGAQLQRVPGKDGYGDSLCASFFNPQTEVPGENVNGVLICAHADTAHELGAIDTLSYRREGNRLWGPGILSMKAGLHITFEVLKQLKANEWHSQVPVTFLLVSDKEVGFSSTKALIEYHSRRHECVLIPEPADGKGGLIIGRSASSRYLLDVKTDTVDELQQGFANSATVEMAQHIVKLAQLNIPDSDFQVGAMQSGQWVNAAQKCTAELICEATTAAALEQSKQQIMAYNSPNPDKGLHINQAHELPLWRPSGESQKLQQMASSIANRLGINLGAPAISTGSVGNIVSAVGVPALDGLGATGFGARTRAEHIYVDSLAERCRLLGQLLLELTSTST